ncbi:MAG: hypothetical protein D3914_08665 [Candidatus Electrothrix sp. LOE2]|nr:hypothetical protein [Candidatus Electrothrix sp. LOE2]
MNINRLICFVIVLFFGSSVIAHSESGVQLNINIDAIEATKEIYRIYKRSEINELLKNERGSSSYNKKTTSLKFYDDFSSNLNEWPLQQDRWSASFYITGGKYVIETKSWEMSEVRAYKDFDFLGFDKFQDFDLSVKLKQLTQYPEKGNGAVYGLMWGDGNGDYFLLGVTGSNLFNNDNAIHEEVLELYGGEVRGIYFLHVSGRSNDDIEMLSLKIIRENILLDGWNTLRLSRRGSRLYFLINDKVAGQPLLFKDFKKETEKNKVLMLNNKRGEVNFTPFDGTSAGIFCSAPNTGYLREKYLQTCAFDDFSLTVIQD